MDPTPTPSQEHPQMPPETENQLLALLDRHLRSTEQTIAKLEQRLDSAVTRMDSAITRMEARLDALGSTLDRVIAAQEAASKRQFWANMLLVVVVAALGSANLYIQASKDDGVVVRTGDAASAPAADVDR